MAKLMVVVSRAVVVGVSDGGSASGGELRHACACRAPASFGVNECMHVPLRGCWKLTVGWTCAGCSGDGKKRHSDGVGLLPDSGLPRREVERLKDNLRMLQERGTAPKLTRERGTDDVGRRPDLRKKERISLSAALHRNFPLAFSWNPGDAHGAAARSEMHRIIGNGEATDGGTLDIEDADELDAMCSIHEKGEPRTENFGKTRLLQGGQGFDGSMCQVPRFNYICFYQGNFVSLTK
uniref:Uncharacterized protein n=1 Tax=Oryza rufipogon TaxID=4529 RepID=A0A0E0RGR3_ORYRU